MSNTTPWSATRTWSHPTRGEWIEMQAIEEDVNVILGLTPHGVSGLKFRRCGRCRCLLHVSPHTG